MALTFDTFLTPQYVADEVLKVSEKTLANWRSRGTGRRSRKWVKRFCIHRSC